MDFSLEVVAPAQARSELARDEAVAVDARSEGEWSRGHVIGAIHIPRGQVTWRSKLLDKGTRLIVIAEDSLCSAQAAIRLSEQGFDAVAVDGGTEQWASSAYNVPRTRTADLDPYEGLGLEY